jgi:hypothetical protein
MKYRFNQAQSHSKTTISATEHYFSNPGHKEITTSACHPKKFSLSLFRWKCHTGQQFAKTANGTCHHFQARGCQRFQLGALYAPEEWQLRRSHSGLFLRFRILFWFHSMTFDGMIIISWCSVLNSRSEPCDLIFGCRNGWLAKRWTDFVCRCRADMNLTLMLIYCWLPSLQLSRFHENKNCKLVWGWSSKNVVVKFYLEKSIVKLLKRSKASRNIRFVLDIISSKCLQFFKSIVFQYCGRQQIVANHFYSVNNWMQLNHSNIPLQSGQSCSQTTISQTELNCSKSSENNQLAYNLIGWYHSTR